MITRIRPILGVATLLILLSGATRAQDITVASMPPSVVKTEPACGDTAVPAATETITVTFSKDMMTNRMWAWCMLSPETFPQLPDIEGIRYLSDKRTCVLPVELEPDKTYAIWINTPENNAFRDTAGNPAVPYLLVFKTGPEETSTNIAH